MRIILPLLILLVSAAAVFAVQKMTYAAKVEAFGDSKLVPAGLAKRVLERKPVKSVKDLAIKLDRLTPKGRQVYRNPVVWPLDVWYAVAIAVALASWSWTIAAYGGFWPLPLLIAPLVYLLADWTEGWLLSNVLALDPQQMTEESYRSIRAATTMKLAFLLASPAQAPLVLLLSRVIQ
jgi:hypothetical protein